jgi:hypothetical protein
MYENVPSGDLIMTPDCPMFDWILNTSPPPSWKNTVNSDFEGFFIVRADTGIMEAAWGSELEEYIEGGELDSIPNPEDKEADFEVNYL